MLDQTSLLIAIGAAAAALTMTLVISWLGARRDRYLLSWACSLALIAVGVAVFSGSGQHYVPGLQFVSFFFMLSGFALLFVGAVQFRTGTTPLALPFGLWAGATVTMGLAFAVGLTGFGTALANLALAMFLMLSAREFWVGRAEFPLPMTMQAVLYGLSAISFVLCGAVLLMNGEVVITARPSNWAEDVNALVVIVALAGVGALTLMLNQMRKTHMHRRLAMIDPLTELLNRRAIFDLSDGGQLAERTAVVMFDIDHFKDINDRFGHATGDAVLRRFADILRENMRHDDHAARLGGEEFCLILTEIDARAACDVAERIRIAFARSSVLPKGSAAPTVSAGVGISREPGESFETLLRRADDALYSAKAAGRDRVQGPGPRLAVA